jgi:hypothetical protein
MLPIYNNAHLFLQTDDLGEDDLDDEDEEDDEDVDI